jgi:murein DD-endopeptidase MepM/ murein hydrolase activator NlpD
MASRVRRFALLIGLIGLLSVVPAQSRASPSPTAVSPNAVNPPIPTFRAPLAGQLTIVHAFDVVANPYAAGHRGVDLAASRAQTVLAAGAGRVTFAGQLAGRGVVVIMHAGDISTEYEPVLASVRVGDVVELGEPIGQLLGTHDGCTLDGCLHWGARRAGVYFDPMSLLRQLGPVRLIPWA